MNRLKTSRCEGQSQLENMAERDKLLQESKELCQQIKEQFKTLKIDHFIVGHPDEDEREPAENEKSNVHFENQEEFDDIRESDFDPYTRLFYITGEYQDRFAKVFGISMVDDELKFHIAKGTEDDNGTEYDDDSLFMSLDEIYDEFSLFQEFNTLEMLKIYLDIMKGEGLCEYFGKPIILS